jgi:tripartite-type tricarboxylate transporter receptor subunit TctC
MSQQVPINRRRFATPAGATALTAPMIAPGIARGQASWKPEKPITIYNPFAAGGVTDVHMRLLAEAVGKILGQRDHHRHQARRRRHAGPGHAAQRKARRLHAGGHEHQHAALSALPADQLEPADFTYITGLSGYTMGIVVRADSPWKTFQDMIAAGKKDPDKYNYGTSGVGGTGQLMMIEVEQATGAKFTHVPYKGGAEWMQALMGGEIQFIADAAQWAPFVDDGKCRVLAFATEKRIPRYPDTPTMIELGVNVVGQSPYGLLGPKGMPPAIVDTLYQAFKRASAEPKVTEYLAKFIQVPWDKNPAEFRAFAEKYYAEVKPLLIKAGLAKP